MGFGTLGFSGFVAGGGGGGTPGATGKSPVFMDSNDFVNATEWDGANEQGRVITSLNTLQVFANYIPRFLREGTEWERTATGINILIADFDATDLYYDFYIYVS